MIDLCLLADAAPQTLPRSPENVLRLRVLGATGILVFTLVMLIVIVGFLMLRWRRVVRERLPSTDYDPDAWARTPLIPDDKVTRDEPV